MAKKKRVRAKKKPPAEKPVKRRGGRPPFEPTEEQRKQVQSLAGFGLKHSQIAAVILNKKGKGISEDTLQKYFRQELDRGTPIAISKVAQSLFQKAIGNGQGSVAAAIFFLKARAGWSEKYEHDVQTNSGVVVVPAAMTPQEWIKQQREANESRECPIVEDA